jgi:hypothetical protein
MDSAGSTPDAGCGVGLRDVREAILRPYEGQIGQDNGVDRSHGSVTRLACCDDDDQTCGDATRNDRRCDRDRVIGCRQSGNEKVRPSIRWQPWRAEGRPKTAGRRPYHQSEAIACR